MSQQDTSKELTDAAGNGEMTIPGRAWVTEAALGHCLFGARQDPLPPLGYDGRRYAEELVDLLRWGVERGINGIYVSHGDPGGMALQAEALRLRPPAFSSAEYGVILFV